ncbi:hypothetical protein CLROS_028100 [Clostridium felsineum]|uniref:Uncharacterized protein n=1 Tax=Clostridium felsineum TaxID=36839 RepID=A0A1S8L315_9CLOT|nr:hypothetical protein CLAUR_044030 [Clostridium felsineum]URZ07472.1 hypothetical protein CLROS_028100 [Clostridium felsineum]URZ12503.1 hypothetical protein CROST_032250 [Clostridium felsineum]
MCNDNCEISLYYKRKNNQGEAINLTLDIKKANSIEEIYNERELYIKSLHFAQEQYLEQIVKKCDVYIIEIESKIKGYFCVNNDKVIYEFYLDVEALKFSQYIFKTIIENGYFTSAECKSYDSLFMSLCLDFHKKASCSGYLFRDFYDTEISLSGFEKLKFRQAELRDVSKIDDINYDFFQRLEEQIVKGEIFVLYSNEVLLGAGVIQKVFHSTNYYDIGMIVNKNYRNRGIGTYIITKLRQIACNKKLEPICGCWYYNYASKKALEKAGFISKHRILNFDF